MYIYTYVHIYICKYTHIHAHIWVQIISPSHLWRILLMAAVDWVNCLITLIVFSSCQNEAWISIILVLTNTVLLLCFPQSKTATPTVCSEVSQKKCWSEITWKFISLAKWLVTGVSSPIYKLGSSTQGLGFRTIYDSWDDPNVFRAQPSSTNWSMLFSAIYATLRRYA